MFKLEEYDEDEIVVRQGDEGDSFYIILYGSVSIWLEPKEDLENTGSEEEVSEGSAYSEEGGSGSEIEGESEESSRSESSSDSDESSSESSSDDEAENAPGGQDKAQAKEDGGAEEGEAAGAESAEGGDQGTKEEEGEANEDEDEEGGRILLCTRGPGDSFGELSLLKNQPRAATVQTDEPTFFVVIDKPDYDRTIKTRHQRKILDKVDFLCKLPVFRKCSITELAEFVCYLSEIDHPRNKIILAQGETSNLALRARAPRAPRALEN